MDRLDAMAVLLKVIDKGSFSAASRELGMPLATVSRKVNELETYLGTRLLVRTTRSVAPTEAGAAYGAKARRILEEIDETERAAAGEFQVPRGELVVTAPILFGRLHILPIVTEFLAAYPEINIRLMLSDRNLQLVEEHVDLAARIGVLPDSSMVATRVGSMRMVTCAAPKLLAEHGVPRSPGDLSALPRVHFEFSPAPSDARLSVTTAEAAVQAACDGVGATRVYHYQCAAAVRSGLLRLILEDFEPEPVPVHLLHAGRGALPTKTRFFLDFAAQRLRARLASL